MKFRTFLFFLLIATFVFSQEKHIAAIKIEGAKKTKTDFIKSLLSTKKGQTFKEVQENINN